MFDTEGIPDEVLRLAEDSNSYQPLGPGEERIETDRYVLFLSGSPHPAANAAQRLRLTAEQVEPTVHEVRSLVAERGLPAFTWEVSTSARPEDLADRLLALGLERFEEPLALAMVLTDPPAGPPAVDLEVRRASTPEEWIAANRIAATAFGHPPGDGAEDIDAARAALEAQESAGHRSAYLAYADGRPVATGWATFTDRGAILNGGSTLPEARGRGAYRALVAARWEEAVRRGTPAVVTQAGAMSRPILRRLGFREVAEIRILLDRVRDE